MAVKKKTVDEIAKEYAIDMSEEAAKKYADAYIQPTLDKIDMAEQQAIADTQAARKTLDNNYFNQYRANTYEAQSRGLTGGLAQMDNQQLRMQLGQANADLSKNLIQTQYNAGLQRGTALANAEAYKTDYLNKIRAQVAELQQADYNQRYQAYIDNENLLLKKQQLQEEADRWEKNYELNKQQFELDNTAANLQNEAYKMELANVKLPEIVNTYNTMLANGQNESAVNYLLASIDEMEKYGISKDELVNNISSIQRYNTAFENYNTSKEALSGGLKWKAALARTIGDSVNSIGIGLAPFTLGLSALATMPISKWGKRKQEYFNNAYNKYKNKLEESNKIVNNTNLIPSWYRQYLGL